MGNELFKHGLRGLGVLALHDLLQDVKARIGDGVLSEHPEYADSQKEKGQLILEELERRKEKKEYESF